MGVLDTTYTFTATDVVTSAKLNNVIDQTTFTATAVTGATLAVSASGQLRVNTITSNEMGSSSVTSTALAIDSVTQAKIAPNVVGKGPLIFAQSSASTSVPTGNTIHTKISLANETVDTNNNFTDSRFTPTVAGYYQVNFGIVTGTGAMALTALLFKNALAASFGNIIANTTYVSRGSIIVFLNGSNDFIELYAQHGQGSTVTDIDGNLSACLIRSYP